MNTTTTPRVEVTPRLLNQLLIDAQLVEDAGQSAMPVATSKIRALVERIRELESGMWWCGCGDSVKQGDRTCECDTCRMGD